MSWTLALASAGLALGACYAYTQFHQHQAAKRNPPAGETVTVNGVDTHLLHEGQGNGDPIVLLHGLNGVLEDFTGPLIDRLAETHEVLALDRPGYGYTQRPRTDLSHLETQTHWLDALLDAYDLDNVLLLGHSLGGQLATLYALDHPERVRALLLLCPYLYPNDAPPDALHGVPDWPVVRHLIANLFVTPIGRPLASKLAARSFQPEPMPPGYVQLWADFSLRPSQFLTVLDEARHLEATAKTTATRYPDLACPTIVLTGTDDRLVDPQAHAHRFQHDAPNAWLKTIDGAGHMLPWTQPNHILQAVTELDHLADQGHPANGGPHLAER